MQFLHFLPLLPLIFKKPTQKETTFLNVEPGAAAPRELLGCAVNIMRSISASNPTERVQNLLNAHIGGAVLTRPFS